MRHAARLLVTLALVQVGAAFAQAYPNRTIKLVVPWPPGQVPYKGSAPAVTDIIAGHVTYTIETSSAVLAHVKAGRLKALAVSSAKRASSLPDLPDDRRGGKPARLRHERLDRPSRAPAGMPRELRMRLTTECQKALEAPEMKDRFLALGLEPGELMPDEFADFLKKQNDRFSSIARQANIKLD